MKALPLVVLATSVAFCCCVNAQSDADPLSGDGHHCSIAQGVPGSHISACQVWGNDPQKFSRPAQIEIYRDHQRIATIELGDPICEWYFWRKDKELVVHSGPCRAGVYRRFETATGEQVAQVAAPSKLSSLPQWAKDRSELEDESVPEGPAYAKQRTLWVAKVLKQLQSIEPGMTRKDLQALLTTEGGLSTRSQQTYVYRQCPYIKVTITFTTTGTAEDDDKILSISKPYLEFSIMD